MKYYAFSPDLISFAGFLRKARQARLGLVIVMFLMGNTACSEQPDSVGTAMATEAFAENLYGRFIAEASMRSTKAEAGQPDLLSDLTSPAFVHDKEPVELWMFLAIVHDLHGNYYAAQQRFGRLAVNTDQAGESDSDWNYNEVFALDYRFDPMADGPVERHSFVQRAALGLAGADVADSRVWLGAFDAQRSFTAECQQVVELTSPKLKLRFSSSADVPHDCKNRDASTLERTSAFSVLRSSAMAVSGFYQNDGQDLNLTGHGWMIRGWGVPPDVSKAAVVFDRAWLLLNNQVEAQLQRSKRASGRGPRITTGTVRYLQTGTNQRLDSEKLSAELTDGKTRSTDNLPSTWALQSSERGLSIKLVPVANAEIMPAFPGQPWFGVVSANGSHDGYGFVEHNLQ